MKLQHQTSGQQIEVAPDHARVYLSQGWVEVQDTTTDQDATTDYDHN